MSTKLSLVSERRCFGGHMVIVSHFSTATQCTMKFSVFVPAGDGPFPVLTFLSGLTCNEETFMIKAGAQRLATEHGFMLVSPDTSPRECKLAGEEDDWDFGVGAGFYLNATRIPWKKHYHMYDYVIRDLQKAVFSNFPGNKKKQGLFGHSMGGNGALTIGIRNPKIYKSISAFSPISAPMKCPWGQKAFSHYLGEDQSAWEKYDASQVISKVRNATSRPEILVDQGMDDEWLEVQLLPHLLAGGARKSGYPLNLRRHRGYDHGYYYISTFMADHFDHQAKILAD